LLPAVVLLLWVHHRTTGALLTTLKKACFAWKYTDSRLKLVSFLTCAAVVKAVLWTSTPSNARLTPVAQLQQAAPAGSSNAKQAAST